MKNILYCHLAVTFVTTPSHELIFNQIKHDTSPNSVIFVITFEGKSEEEVVKKLEKYMSENQAVLERTKNFGCASGVFYEQDGKFNSKNEWHFWKVDSLVRDAIKKSGGTVQHESLFTTLHH